MAKNYKSLSDQSKTPRFLDIGSGYGANSKYLEDEGFNVISIDIAPQSKGASVHAIGDICEIDTWVSEQFDCIFDIETLQHVENPPYEGIYKALKPGGKFFSIHCAPDTEVDMTGKGFTRFAAESELRRLLAPSFKFDDVNIHKTTNWNGLTKISSWQIEATK